MCGAEDQGMYIHSKIDTLRMAPIESITEIDPRGQAITLIQCYQRGPQMLCYQKYIFGRIHSPYHMLPLRERVLTVDSVIGDDQRALHASRDQANVAIRP